MVFMKLTNTSRQLDLSTPQIMGILNATPDSFSDGGQFSDVDRAYDHAMRMIEQGASIIDIGGESTRPGATAVGEQEELHRVIPLIERLRNATDTWLSLDSSNAVVMQEACVAGIDLLNDVRSFSAPGALAVAINSQLPICIMHMLGTPSTMQLDPCYSQVVDDVTEWLQLKMDELVKAGVSKDKIICDPGFGFGKTMNHNFQLLASVDRIVALGCPVLIGLSRKSMFGQLLTIETPAERITASVVAAYQAATAGAHIFRVHDVEQTKHALAVLAALRNVNG